MCWTARIHRYRGFGKRIASACLLLSGLALCSLSSTSMALSDPMHVIYPRSYSDADTRANYYVKLLDLALSKSGASYTLRPSEFQMMSVRMLQKLESDDGIDVTWGPSTRDYEQRLLPIRIVLDKGILGWRIFLIKAQDRAQFEKIQTIEQLQVYAAGQQREWADTTVLQANGLKVVDAVSYEWLFRMLAADRFQYFPRGIGEIWSEQKNNAGLGLEVEQHLALHYPAYTYFFVRKGNLRLAGLIENGLRAAMQDGSFDKLFEQYNGDAVRRAHLNQRIVFELHNPLLPDTKPLLQDRHPINR